MGNYDAIDKLVRLLIRKNGELIWSGIELKFCDNDIYFMKRTGNTIILNNNLYFMCMKIIALSLLIQ